MKNYMTILITLGVYSLVYGVANAIIVVNDMRKDVQEIKIISILISL